MSFAILLLTLLLSALLCNLIDGLPEFLGGWFQLSTWGWAGLGIMLLTWLMGDR